MKRHIVLLGPPGSGKGTVAQQLETAFHLEHVSTGDWFRREISRGTQLGLEVKGYIARGELVPDELVLSLVDHWLTPELIEHGYLFDGFPRTEAQAQALDLCCEQKHAAIDAVLYLDCPDELIVQRICGRRVCVKCAKVYHAMMMPPITPGICDSCGAVLIQRPDDTAEVIQKRLVQYRKATAPLIDYYRRTNRLITVRSANGDAVFTVAAHVIED
jgi:adenylate kinase